MKSAYVRVIVAGLLLGGLGTTSACGSSEEDNENNPGDAGSGGSSASTGKGGSGATGKGGSGGTTEVPDPIECGSDMCEALVLPTLPPVEACCTPEDTCGLDSSVLEAFGPMFDEACQARDQPGELDDNCPASMSTMVQGIALEFPGCCREDGRCGYMLDSIAGIYQIGMGCVDSAPFLDGEEPPTCGDGGGGAPGGGGAGGTPGAAGAGGDPGAGGAGGATSAPEAGAGGAAAGASSAGAGGA